MVNGETVQALALASDKNNGVAATDLSLPSLNRTTNGFTSINTISGNSNIQGPSCAKWVYGTQYVTLEDQEKTFVQPNLHASWEFLLWRRNVPSQVEN